MHHLKVRLAAYMTQTGNAYASASQDFDSVLFGAKKLVRNFTNSGRRKIPNRNTYVDVVPEYNRIKSYA